MPDADPPRGDRREPDLLQSTVGPAPLVVFDRLLTVVGATELAERVYSAFRVGRNLARETFLDGDVHPELPDWPRKTLQVAAMLRACSSGMENDAGLVGLVGELSSLSREFARAWAADARERETDVFEFMHAEHGSLRLRYHLLRGPRRGADTVAVWHAADAASLLGLRAIEGPRSAASVRPPTPM